MQIVCQTHGVGEGEVICSECVKLVEQKINSLQHRQPAIVLAQNYMAPFSYGSTIRQVMEGFIVWVQEQQQADA